MVDKNKLDPKSFLDDAEKIMRNCVTRNSNSNLIVWRGKFPHKFLDSVYEYDTIVAGLDDKTDSAGSPTIPIMKVSQEINGLARIEFEYEESESSNVPFGGGWYPLREVERLAKKLQDL